MATLVDGVLEEGAHEYSWNAANIPGGMYFCALTGPGFNEVVKLLLLK